jgi:hypothetical protein
MLEHYSFLSFNRNFRELRLTLIKTHNQDALCKYIEHEVMQHVVPFKRVRDTHTDYMIIETDEKKGMIEIKQPFLMRVMRGKLEFHYHRSERFFVEEQRKFKLRIERDYIPALSNFINANVLMNELIATYELPTDPHELWMGETVNQNKIKYVASTNKKVTKKNHPTVSKFLTKKASKPPPSRGEVPQEVAIPTTPSTAPKIILHRLFRKYLPLSDRIPSKTILIYLLEDQVLNFSIIHNMKNLYLFERFIGEDHVILYFEEVHDQALIKEISEENQELAYSKCRNHLVYSAFCLNPLLDPKAVDNKIKPRLNDVIQKLLFDEVAKSLLVSPKWMPEF